MGPIAGMLSLGLSCAMLGYFLTITSEAYQNNEISTCWNWEKIYRSIAMIALTCSMLLAWAATSWLFYEIVHP